jgi:hypothetical protein
MARHGPGLYTYMKHELFEELEAWHPQWRAQARTIRDAAERAGVMELYTLWLQTPEGKKYLVVMSDVPDVKSAIEKSQEAASRLPFGLSNLGTEK